MLPGFTHFFFSSVPPDIKIVDQKTLNGTGSPKTFTDVNFGDAYPGRVLVACFGLYGTYEGAADQTSCTIGGVSAAGDDAGKFPDGGPVYGGGLWGAKVENGTSGTVVLNYSGSTTSCTMYLVSVPSVLMPQHSVDGAQSNIFSSDWTDIVPITALGSVVVCVVHAGTSGANTVFTGLTKRAESLVGGGTISIGYDQNMQANTGKTINVDWPNLTFLGGGAHISFSKG